MSERRRYTLGGGYARWVLAGTILAASLFAAGQSTPQQSNGEAINLVFKVDHQVITLSDAVRGALIEQADKIVRSCWYDLGDREETVWREALAETSSIRLSYEAPIGLRLLQREIQISEAIFSIEDPDFLGSPVMHHAGRTTRVVKCDGYAMLGLMCTPGLAAHFPPNYQKSCHLVRPN